MATDSLDQLNFNPTTTAITSTDRLEEGEKEPTDEASDQPSVITVDSDTKNSTGLRFWSSTTHLRLHSITVSKVTLIHCKKATDASNFPISLSGPVRLCNSIF